MYVHQGGEQHDVTKSNAKGVNQLDIGTSKMVLNGKFEKKEWDSNHNAHYVINGGKTHFHSGGFVFMGLDNNYLCIWDMWD